jgi:predicted DsbA family dithiol-disulfide isomerase
VFAELEPDVTGQPIEIAIVFDPACPWCFIGKRQLERALALRPGLPVRLRWWPFLLFPDLPREGADRPAHLVRHYGSEARARRAQQTAEQAGQALGIAFAFDRLRRQPNPIDAHRLIRFAAADNRADELVEALMFAHFVEGRDLGKAGELIAVAANQALDRQAVRAHLATTDDVDGVLREHARARRLGIHGVPTFVFNGNLILSGAQEPGILARMLDVAGVAASVEAAPVCW